MTQRNGKSLTPVERAIRQRENGIARMKQNILRIREQASKDEAEIQGRIREKQVLLDALKRGSLKPQATVN